MSEEALEAIENIDVENIDESTDEIEHTELEIEQMKEGWIPPERQDQIEGKKYLSAEEYKERGKFFKKISAQNDALDLANKRLAHLEEQYQKKTERELKKANDEHEAMMKSLMAEKVQALDEGDSQRVVEIDEQMRTPPPQQEAPPVQDNAEADRLISEWKTENKWYDNDEDLREQADMLASRYASQNKPIGEALPQIAARMKALFPHKFENPRRNGAPAVEGGGSPKPRTGKVSEKSLTAEERTMYHDLEMDKYLKTDEQKQKYFKDVIEARD